MVVLGGGIIGLSCALEASLRGFQVTLIEPGKLGGQASGAAAGMLAPYSENTEQPDAFFELSLASLRRYPEWIRLVEELSGRHTEWVRSGSLGVCYHEADIQPMTSRLEWQNAWGARAELLDNKALQGLEPALTDQAVCAVYYPEESHVHAPLLVSAVEEACRRQGVQLVAQAGEAAVLDTHSESGAAVQTASAGRYSADRLMVCAGAWSGAYERWLGIPVPIHPIRGQICSYDVPYGEVGHMIMTSQAYWVGKQNNQLVCGASEDVAGFDATVTERGIGRLIRSTQRALPFLAGREPTVRWAGLRPATPDGLPLLGVVPDKPEVIVAAGHYRNGILLCPITAAVTGALLQGKLTDDLAALRIEACAPHRFRTGHDRRYG